ncbi:hypothetical protein ACFVAD_20610 [Sutcliffiella sp. NPDC057660]|uniref:hypothetical protein n=1 Tax=Sutcliffiella sp. NPDC057660 TaxID=3346199 RepID=UPI0036AC38B6
MKKLCIYITVLSFCFLLSSRSVMAGTYPPQKVVDKFMQQFLNEKSINSDVFDGVYIPEINIDSPIGEYNIVPTPQRKDTMLVVAFYKDEIRDDRVAFIWELVVKNDKVSHIETIHNGTIPLLEEAKLVKEYELKFKKNVIVPTSLPFEITDFDGYIYKDSLELIYRSEPITGMLKVTVSPIERPLEEYEDNQSQIHALKDGTKVIFLTINPAAEVIIFQKKGLQYNIGVGNKKYLKKEFDINDLLQIAESMN